MMFKRIRAFLDVPNQIEAMKDRQEGLAVDAARYTGILEKMLDELRGTAATNKALVDEATQMHGLTGAMEMAGIRRVFGGEVDVDYDKLLNALGPSGENELLRVLRDRQKKPVAKRTAERPSRKAKAAKVPTNPQHPLRP